MGASYRRPCYVSVGSSDYVSSIYSSGTGPTRANLIPRYGTLVPSLSSFSTPLILASCVEDHSTSLVENQGRSAMKCYRSKSSTVKLSGLILRRRDKA